MKSANRKLWEPSLQRAANSCMYEFSQRVAEEYRISIDGYDDLYEWSVNNIASFWQTVWDYCGVSAEKTSSTVVQNSDQFPGARWFPEARLNFAENLLKYRDNRPAIVSLLENGDRHCMSYAELYEQVEKLASVLRQLGVKVGDRVAGFMPNMCETVVAMLATTSIGAIWSSCSADFGIQGARDRFSQINPKVLFAADAYLYNGKKYDCLDKVSELIEAIPSLKKAIIVALFEDELDVSHVKHAARYDECLLQEPVAPLQFESLPFDHPVYIMYSSGTTGSPKCIVHGAGGTLLQHKKELMLHTDIRRDDVLFYFTTCGWMMWNWLVSGLACGCTLVLYDGSPFANEGKVLLDAIDSVRISVFGASAKYFSSLEKASLSPRKSHSLESLKTILSTGSPLSKSSYEYIYQAINQDVCLSSICGGTDIISCFMLGNPMLPVFSGEIQCRGLGMAVEFYNEDGDSLSGEKGELVCVTPFPSTPVGFWNDPQGKKFRAAYFERYPNVWAHGDYGEVTERGTIIIHGRSDATLNPGGVRIGTAEIYRQVEKLPEVIDSVVVGQRWKHDERVVLFVRLQDGVTLNNKLVKHIKQTIRQSTTARHVPEKVIAVADIPRTLSGKTVELAVKKIIHGDKVTNTDALANPESLQYFKALPELQV